MKPGSPQRVVLIVAFAVVAVLTMEWWVNVPYVFSTPVLVGVIAVMAIQYLRTGKL